MVLRLCHYALWLCWYVEVVLVTMSWCLELLNHEYNLILGGCCLESYMLNRTLLLVVQYFSWDILPSRYRSMITQQACVLRYVVFFDLVFSVTIFTHFTYSSKFEAPKHSFKSWHGIILSYLIFSYLFIIFSHFKSHKSRRRKADSIAIQRGTIYTEEGATTHSFSLSDSPNPSKSNSSSASLPPCGQVLS